MKKEKKKEKKSALRVFTFKVKIGNNPMMEQLALLSSDWTTATYILFDMYDFDISYMVRVDVTDVLNPNCMSEQFDLKKYIESFNELLTINN